MARWMACGLALLLVLPVFAGGPKSVRKQFVSSMLVTGTIEVEPDGTVGSYILDQPEKLPAAVVDIVGNNVPHWRFEPVVVDGRPVRARSSMGLRIVAKRQEDGRYLAGIRNASFGDKDIPDDQRVTMKEVKPPVYPAEALRQGLQGTVYLLLKIGRDGAVTDVMAEQINMSVFGSDQQMRQGRRWLGIAAVQAAKGWSFRVPVAGERAGRNSWELRVPVDFQIGDSQDTGYGKWTSYLPGPHQTPPWWTEPTDITDPDAMVAGQVQQVGTGLRLQTALDQG